MTAAAHVSRGSKMSIVLCLATSGVLLLMVSAEHACASADGKAA